MPKCINCDTSFLKRPDFEGFCVKMLVTLAYIVSGLILHVKGKNGCRDLEYLKCVPNKTLTGHVISSFSLLPPALSRCQHQCFLEGKCVSYNLGPVQGIVRPCELNAADLSTRPTFLVHKTGYEYCAIRNPCLSNPCPAGRLCTPDLSWDTYNCNDGGWTQWSSWTGCFLSSFCNSIRTRSCSSPVPLAKGVKCHGQAVETRKCRGLGPVTSEGCKCGDKLLLKARSGKKNYICRKDNGYIIASKNRPDSTCEFQVIKTESACTVLLKADNGNYVCRFNDGSSDYIKTHVNWPAPACYLTVFPQPDGTFALRANNGKYLSEIYQNSAYFIRPTKHTIDVYCKFKRECKCKN